MEKEYLIYYGSIILSSIFAWLSQIFAKDRKNTFKLNKFFYAISFIILLIVIGLRKSGVGVDDWQYSQIFERVRQHGPIAEFMQETMEPGYLIINYIVGLFTSDFQIFLFVISFISLLFFYKALEYERKNVNFFLSFFLFGTILYLYFFGIIRLFLAVGIISYAVRYLFENNKKKYVTWVLIAASIHYSALFMLVFLYFINRKQTKEMTFKFFGLLTIIIPTIILLISKVVFPIMGQRYSNYLILNKFTITLDVFDKIPIIISCILFIESMRKNNKNINMYLILYSTAMLISLFSSIVDIGRIQWYFNFSSCIILPTLARAIFKSDIRYKGITVLLVPIIFLYGVLYSYMIVWIQPSNVYMRTYSNILFK